MYLKLPHFSDESNVLNNLIDVYDEYTMYLLIKSPSSNENENLLSADQFQSMSMISLTLNGPFH